MANIFDDSYSNEIIERLNLIEEHDFGEYKNFSTYQSLVFSYYGNQEAQIVQTKDNNIVLRLNGRIVDMTPLIEQRCKALLYKYKLEHEQYISKEYKDKKYLEQAKDIIATEQKRDIYQQCAGISPKHCFMQKNKPYFIMFVPDNATVIYTKNALEIHGKYKPLFKLLTRFIYNNGESAEINIKKKDDSGFVCKTPNGNQFDFINWNFAQIFAQSFDKDHHGFSYLYYPNPNRILMRVKTGITR